MSSKSSTGSTLSRSKSSRRRGTTSLGGSPRLDGQTRRARSRSSPSRAFRSGRRTSSHGASPASGARCSAPPRSFARRRSALSGERAFPICKIASPSNGGRCEHWRGSGGDFSPPGGGRGAQRRRGAGRTFRHGEGRGGGGGVGEQFAKPAAGGALEEGARFQLRAGR